MKRGILIVIVVGAVACTYFVGWSQGRSSGFEDGVVWGGQGDAICKGMRAIAILRVLEQTNYTGVAEALNHDVDYAIFEALRAEEQLADVRLPRTVQKQMESLREAFELTGTVDDQGFRVLAKFRREHASDSTDKDIVEATQQLLEEYQCPTSPGGE